MSGKGNVQKITVAGLAIDVERRGSGRPLVLMASEEQLELEAAFVDDLAKKFEVIMPAAPGFGTSDRPDWLTNPNDLSYIMLDVIDALDLKDVTLVGFSLGGWIAAEMAIKNTSRISKLVLVDAFGVKIGGAWDRDIMDIWTSHPTKVMEAKWANPENAKRDFSVMNDDQLTVVARNMESFARFCWSPYMHNPNLRHRLHRVTIPTLFIWGEKDGITPPAYGEAYSKLVPGAKFVTIAKAGHYPHLEATDAFMSALNGFIN